MLAVVVLVEPGVVYAHRVEIRPEWSGTQGIRYQERDYTRMTAEILRECGKTCAKPCDTMQITEDYIP